MRTTSEILEAVREGQEPEYKEIYMALLVLANLRTFDAHDLLNLIESDIPKLRFLAEESFKRTISAMNVSPEHYLGVEWTPNTPEYKTRRAFNEMLWKKIFGEDREE